MYIFYTCLYRMHIPSLESVPMIVVGMTENTSRALITGGSVELGAAMMEMLYWLFREGKLL